MSRYLMTHSLLSSWLYSLKENPYEDAASESKPEDDFMRVLRREPTPTTSAMQFGMDNEDLVTAVLTGIPTAVYHKENKDKSLTKIIFSTPDHPWYQAAYRSAQIIGESVLQFRARKEVTAAGMDFVLYGRLDALRAGVIYDIKFCNGYERGKYFNSTQHPTYLEIVPEAQRFIYVISNGSEVWTEKYEREETPSIFPVISDFVNWLDTMGLMDLYREKWLAL